MTLAASHKPTVLDLFSGCGGFSLGFHRADFEIVGGVEIDPIAYSTHSTHFHPKAGPARPCDIRKLNVESVIKPLDGGPPTGIDVIIGGPPCQPFTRVGRAKLRDVTGNGKAHIEDSRVPLFIHFLRFIEELRPSAFVMENVHHIANFGGRNIAEEVAVRAEGLGYNVRYAILNAAWYGVPQMRERLILIGIDACLGQVPSFPKRTHWIELPVGYTTSRSGRLGYVPVLKPCDHYVSKVPVEENQRPAVTAAEAIGDLPPLTFHLGDPKARKGPRRFDNLLSYRSIRPSEYARRMREWPGFESNGGVVDHVIRYTPRDYETFRRMKPGDQYPEAYAIAERRFRRALSKADPPPKPGTKAFNELRASIAPPYDPHKFPNKWRKMEPDRPVRTIPAHIGKDSYSHIHYDSDQARTISVREAARFHSFPDGFRFTGRMNAAFRQIGDSVPPLMAYAIARALKSQLRPGAEVPQAYARQIPVNPMVRY